MVSSEISGLDHKKIQYDIETRSRLLIKYCNKRCLNVGEQSFEVHHQKE